MTAPFLQSITGLTPPQLSEARVREIWPSVAAAPAVAGLGRALTNTIILAPLGWLIMSVVYFGKLMPMFMRRYSLTNRRLRIRHGWAGSSGPEILLKDIDDVRLITDSNSEFFRAADLQIIKGGNVALTLAGVPDPESFRQMILNTRNAWVPGKAQTLPFIPASATK
jgi:hypothetical protein